MRFYILLLAIVFAQHVRAEKTTEVIHSDSPNHLYRLQVSDSSQLSLISRTGKLPNPLEIDSYAVYPYNADPKNLMVAWSPSSSHLALTFRSSKRTWETKLYAISTKGFSLIELPSATECALKLLRATEIFRWGHENPVTWTDKDSMVIHASGDTTQAGKTITYEVDVTYSVPKRSILSVKLVSTKPEEG